MQTQSKAEASADLALVLERLPSGDYAYLRPIEDEPHYVLTDAGRRALRVAELFGTDAA